MLRRKFIKSSSLTLGGIIALSSLPTFCFKSEAAPMTTSEKTGKTQRMYHLHGDARSGCASPPELAAFYENGIMSVPPGWNG